MAWNPLVCFVYDQDILLPTLYIMTERQFATVLRKSSVSLLFHAWSVEHISAEHCGIKLSDS